MAFAEALLAWGEATLRDLPWRHTRDPWAVLVSETMAQQTQVARVVPSWEAFMADFPTATACADAAVGEIVRRWDGLGYNRRAVNLHRAATVVRDDHGGSLPDTLDGLLALPGVGPYTARAVLSFAFEADGHGVLDTNVARVLARAVEGRSLGRREAQERADGLVPAGRAWLWNQSVMELGAVVCRKRSPQCDACPVAAHCTWRRAGGPDGVDPADGTAGASTPQSRFEGSDRQGRGRLVSALRSGPVPVEHVAAVTGWDDDPDRARRVADGLAADGLAEYMDGMLVLPA